MRSGAVERGQYAPVLCRGHIPAGTLAWPDVVGEPDRHLQYYWRRPHHNGKVGVQFDAGTLG
jgi:hypothetical protein